jgi:serine protease AprX
LTDAFGHGTHVAGIIAGAQESSPVAPIIAARNERDEHGDVSYQRIPLTNIAGMAPLTTLLSDKVLDDDGGGDTSTIITALERVAEVNGYGRNLLIHGVNLSVGYSFNPEWFTCGASPLCVVVDRLVRSGVVVVVAAGNTGYGWNQDYFKSDPVAAGLDMTINDPGNAALAITVGSTHRDMPHLYGVSHFSSKGPTGDGRAKPDLVAPGERILSCGTGRATADARIQLGPVQYVEDSGTSMAAPHVSGCIASFLSIRREYIGRPEDVKKVFLDSATDLGRVPAFQGRGLVDLMRAIQSV